MRAERGSVIDGIGTNPFVDAAFEAVEYRIVVTVHDAGGWSYDEDTVLRVAGHEGLFHQTDRNRLRRAAESQSNPLARWGTAGRARSATRR